jgi:hypothetical protein
MPLVWEGACKRIQNTALQIIYITAIFVCFVNLAQPDNCLVIINWPAYTILRC